MRRNVKSLAPQPVDSTAAFWGPNDGRVFQASNSFVHACIDATMAMHALSAKVKELEKLIGQSIKASAKLKASPRASAATKAARSRAAAK